MKLYLNESRKATMTPAEWAAYNSLPHDTNLMDMTAAQKRTFNKLTKPNMMGIAAATAISRSSATASILPA